MTALDLAALQPALADWLGRRHADASAVAVSGLTQASGGYSNVTLTGELSWRRGGVPERGGIVVRMQPPGDAVFPDCDVARQYRTMQALAGSAVPVPALLGLQETASPIGAPFFVMRRVDGRVPNENPLYHQQGWLHDLDAGAQRAHWFAGIDTVAAVSRIDASAPAFDFLRPPPGVTPLAHGLAVGGRHLAWAERLGRPYPALRAAERWLLAHQPGEQAVALSWGDAKLGNCVFRDGRVVAALDWETAALSSPVDDLAWWLVHDESLSAGYGVPRLAGLPAREETVAHWERASGHHARDLDYYEVLAAWRFAIVMARIGTLFMQRGWVPPESAMDLNNGAAAVLATRAARHGF